MRLYRVQVIHLLASRRVQSLGSQTIIYFDGIMVDAIYPQP